VRGVGTLTRSAADVVATTGFPRFVPMVEGLCQIG
jgi:hypothetical protein